MGDQRERTSRRMDQRARPDERHSLSRQRSYSHASRRGEQQQESEEHRSSRSTTNSDNGECWVQESCQGGVVQYCSQASSGNNRTNTPLQAQHNQGAKEGQELYDSMKRAMEKKLRENRRSYQEQNNPPFWKPLCKKEQEAAIYPITCSQLASPISTKDELLRVYRESIRRGELASLCMKTKKGRETLTLSVMVKSQESLVPQNPGCREEGFDCYVPAETFPDYLPMCPKTKADHGHGEAVQLSSGVDMVKHHHH